MKQILNWFRQRNLESDLDRAFAERRSIIDAVKAAGYRFVTMDL